MTLVKRRKGWRMSCDVGKSTEGMSSAHSPTFPSLHLRHNLFSNPSVALPTSQLILQPFRCFTYITVHSPTLYRFTYVTAHSPTLPSLYLRHSSFSNPFISSHTSQLILQPFFCFSYITGSSLTYVQYICIFQVIGHVNISGHWHS